MDCICWIYIWHNRHNNGNNNFMQLNLSTGKINQFFETICFISRAENAELRHCAIIMLNFLLFFSWKMATFWYSINIVALIRDQKFTVATVLLRVIRHKNTEKQRRQRRWRQNKKKLFEKHNIRKGNETWTRKYLYIG